MLVIAILFVVAGLVLPLIVNIRQKSHLGECKNNLRRLGLASHKANDANGCLPPALGWYGGRSYGNVLFHLLPFLQAEDLFQSAMTTEGEKTVYLPWHNDVFKKPVRVFLCPDNPAADGNGMTDVGWAASCYAYNGQVFANIDHSGRIKDWEGKASIPATFQNGTSYTLLFTEKYPRCQEFGSLWAAWDEDRWQPTFAIWSIGPDAMFQSRPHPYLGEKCDPTRASSPHPDSILACLADASVRPIKNTISPDVWWQICCPNNVPMSLPDVGSADNDWNVFGRHRR